MKGTIEARCSFFFHPKNTASTPRSCGDVSRRCLQCLWIKMSFHFLLTTTALLNSQFPSHIQQSSYTIYNDLFLPGEFHGVNYGLNKIGFENTYSTSSITAMCSSSSNDFNSKEVQSILKDYYFSRQKENAMEWSVNQPNMSCVLFDETKSLLWLVGDHAGSIPLWFAFQSDGKNTEIVVTSDLFACVNLGYSDLTAVGAGLALAFDTLSFDLVRMNHWSQYHQDEKFHEPELENASSWSASILDSAKSALSVYNSSSSFLLTELDLLDASSILLECAMSPQRTRARYHKAPLVMDPKSMSIIDPHAQSQFVYFHIS
jgi:hypothetical protein